MARHRTIRRAISVSRLARQSNTSNVTPADHARLWHLLLSKPQLTLSEFQECGIGSLCELSEWAWFRVAAPDACARVIAVAALYGIPECRADLTKTLTHGKT